MLATHFNLMMKTEEYIKHRKCEPALFMIRSPATNQLWFLLTDNFSIIW